MNHVEETLGGDPVRDNDDRGRGLALCFTIVVSVIYLAGEYQNRVAQLFYGTLNLAVAAFLVIMQFLPSVMGGAVLRIFGRRLRLERWESRLFIGFSHPLAAYIYELVREGDARGGPFPQSLYIAWKEWGNGSIMNVWTLLALLLLWVLGVVWVSLADILWHPLRSWRWIRSRMADRVSEAQTTVFRESPHESMEYSSAPQLEAGSGPAAAVPVDAFLGYWGERASVLKHTLWWAGLMLLLPAPVSLLCQRAVHHLFTLFPVQALGSDAAVEVIVLERVLISVSLGILCWILCAVLDVLLRRRHESTTPPHPVGSVDRQLIVTAVSTVLVISACLVALLCLTGINLHGTTAAS